MTDNRSKDVDALLRLHHGGPADRRELAALAGADPEIGQLVAEWGRQDAALLALYNPVAEEPVPHRHKALIAAAAAAGPQPAFAWMRRIAAVVALVAVGAGAGWFAAFQQVPAAAGADLATNALRAFSTYAVEVAHPVEVLASDDAHLEGWLSKRLGRSFVPPDLSGNGFNLLGGRVVPDPNGTAAMMMYEDTSGRRITLYVAPTPDDTETALRFARNDAAQGFWWVDEQLGCGLFGDLPRETLRAISLAAYQQINDA